MKEVKVLWTLSFGYSTLKVHSNCATLIVNANFLGVVLSKTLIRNANFSGE